MEKIIQSLINNWVRGVDTYTHNGSTWLIFTDKKKWVIELTDDKTLWYNYNFFKQIFEFTSLNVVDNQQYITKWVEDNIINKVSDIHFRDARDRKQQFEYTLENGVKKIRKAHMKTNWSVEDTIENGVKKTNSTLRRTLLGVDDIIQNGVKETYLSDNSLSKGIEYTIENGVRHTQTNSNRNVLRVENTIRNGVKETQFNSYENESWVEGVIKGGVKETKSDDFNVSQFLCEEVIDKGVKETNHVDVMKFFDNKMEDTLENGVRLTEYQIGDTFDEIDDIIENGVKSSIPRQYVGENIIDKIIDKGELETYDVDWDVPTDLIEDVINNDVKETTALDPSFSFRYTNGDMEMVPKVEEIIKNGEKINGTYVGGSRQKENINSVIGYGTKNPPD